MISETTIRKVRELAIEDVLSPYVRLSRKGSTLMGPCPFHTEKTGSFAVTPGKNLFHCFSCNRGGDSITFIMEKENLSFSAAVEFIARNHNIPVEYISEERSEEQMAEARHRESLLAVLDTVQTFFLQNLRATDKEESLDARAYAYGRWHEEFCAFAGIGYAPKDGQAFMDFCRSKALNEELLYELGMFKRGEDGNTYAMFRQRIMIPVRNRWGRIIAYTARYIGDNRKAPKYINSATSMIYSKGETVFGIDRAARLRDADYYIIVEGAPDVLRMQSIGYDNTVASLGTA
jgi:DNA primase